MGIVRTLKQQWLGAMGIIIGVTGVAFGATGQPVLLGTRNQADKPTIIQNMGVGPAATFVVKAGKPPFAVISAVQVPRLNASMLGGKSAAAFETAGTGYSKTESDAKYAPSTVGRILYSAGFEGTTKTNDGNVLVVSAPIAGPGVAMVLVEASRSKPDSPTVWGTLGVAIVSNGNALSYCGSSAEGALCTIDTSKAFEAAGTLQFTICWWRNTGQPFSPAGCGSPDGYVAGLDGRGHVTIVFFPR
jgi:hypothetical protein